MVQTHVIQVSTELPNPVKNLSGYEPTTEYWPMVITLVNALIEASAVRGLDAKKIQEDANMLIGSGLFDEEDEHTAVQWAEFVMAINHILWFWHGASEQEGIEYLDPVLKALNDLYYQWHDKALNTLKGDDLSTYLRITD